MIIMDDLARLLQREGENVIIKIPCIAIDPVSSLYSSGLGALLMLSGASISFISIVLPCAGTMSNLFQHHDLVSSLFVLISLKVILQLLKLSINLLKLLRVP